MKIFLEAKEDIAFSHSILLNVTQQYLAFQFNKNLGEKYEYGSLSLSFSNVEHNRLLQNENQFSVSRIFRGEVFFYKSNVPTSVELDKIISSSFSGSNIPVFVHLLKQSNDHILETTRDVSVTFIHHNNHNQEDNLELGNIDSTNLNSILKGLSIISFVLFFLLMILYLSLLARLRRNRNFIVKKDLEMTFESEVGSSISRDDVSSMESSSTNPGNYAFSVIEKQSICSSVEDMSISMNSQFDLTFELGSDGDVCSRAESKDDGGKGSQNEKREYPSEVF